MERHLRNYTVALDLFHWLKSSPARREDYARVLSDLGLHDELFIRHVQCRWLTLLPALERIVKNWEAVKKYFLEELPKQSREERTIKNLEKNERYNRICRKLQDKSFPAQLAFLLSVEPIFKKFLCFFQSERATYSPSAWSNVWATEIGNASFPQEPSH